MALTTKTVVRGNFTFEAEEFATNRWRPKSVKGNLVHTHGASKGKRKGNLALCQFETGKLDRTLLDLMKDKKYNLDANYDGGHLVALDLGGIEHPLNVVPMPSYFNRHGEWRGAERFMSGVMSGRQVKVHVVVSYPDDTTPVPNKIAIHYEYPDPTPTEQDKVFKDVKELTSQIFTRQEHEIPDKVYGQFKTHIPVYCQAEGLQNQNDVPYRFLTYLNGVLDTPIIDPSKVVAGGKFTKEQRLYVWHLNCWNNNPGKQKGCLCSDIKEKGDGKDEHGELNTKGCLSFPQVDHIKPASKGGKNSFDNCQLTSAWYNNQKRAGYIRTKADWEEIKKLRTKREVRDSVKKQRVPLSQLKKEELKKHQEAEIKAARKKAVQAKRDQT
jgi:hypothetical protein